MRKDKLVKIQIKIEGGGVRDVKIHPRDLIKITEKSNDVIIRTSNERKSSIRKKRTQSFSDPIVKAPIVKPGTGKKVS